MVKLFVFLSAVAISIASAAPFRTLTFHRPNSLVTRAAGTPRPVPYCDFVDSSLLEISTLPAPSEKIEYVFLGRGIQNYTCNSTSGHYVSVGAVANLYDISCQLSLLDVPGYTDALPAVALKSISFPNGTPSLEPFLTAQHFFIKNPSPGGIGLAPKFVLVDNPEIFVAASKLEDVPAPDDPTENVDWLALNALIGTEGGTLGKQVYRVNTAGGQPPSTCTPGDNSILSVQYAALYYFFK